MKGKFIDLTSLTGKETEVDIINLCNKAKKHSAYVAGVCTWYKWQHILNEQLKDTDIRSVSVLGFPSGNTLKLEEDISSLPENWNTDEIDIVDDYHHIDNHLSKNVEMASLLNIPIKLILETGILTPIQIRWLSRRSINKVKFLKTSTGKVDIGATTQAVMILAEEVKLNYMLTGSYTGIKISGGIKNNHQAQQFIEIIANMLGNDFLNTETFRIGIGTSSTLLEEWQ